MSLLSHFSLLRSRYKDNRPTGPSGASILVDDEYYSKCVVLLPGTGSNGSTYFSDAVDNEWTPSGNAQVTTSSPIYGSSSILLDGTGDYIAAVIPSAIGTGDFTVRAKIKIASLTSDGEIFSICHASRGLSTFDLVFEYKATGALRGSIQNGAGTANVDISTATGLLTTGTVYDVAFVADGSTARLYIDGVQRQSGAITGTRSQSNTTCTVGCLSPGTGYPRYFNGRINQLQVYKGVCLYPAGTTFTPPANADRPQLPHFPLSSRINTPTTNDAQGVAYDGTYYYFSSSTTLYKYNSGGSLVTSRSVVSDNPTTKDQINGLLYRDGILYVCAAKYAAGVGTSWVAEYDPSTLTPTGVVHNITVPGHSGAFIEGIAFGHGCWWMVFHASMIVACFDPSFNFIGVYTPGFTITGSSGGYGPGVGYDGIAWMGDYLLCNIHEIYDQAYLDVYYWSGSGLVNINRKTTRGDCGQGLSLPSSGTLICASRVTSGSDGIVVRNY